MNDYIIYWYQKILNKHPLLTACISGVLVYSILYSFGLFFKNSLYNLLYGFAIGAIISFVSIILLILNKEKI